MIIFKSVMDKMIHKEQQRQIKEGLIKEKNDTQLDNEYALIIQKRLRGILARKKVEEMR